MAIWSWSLSSGCLFKTRSPIVFWLFSFRGRPILQASFFSFYESKGQENLTTLSPSVDSRWFDKANKMSTFEATQGHQIRIFQCWHLIWQRQKLFFLANFWTIYDRNLPLYNVVFSLQPWFFDSSICTTLKKAKAAIFHFDDSGS